MREAQLSCIHKVHWRNIRTSYAKVKSSPSNTRIFQPASIYLTGKSDLTTIGPASLAIHQVDKGKSCMAFKIFFCYAHEDERLLQKLKAHLKPLQRKGLVDQLWHDRDISAGTEWEPEISKQLKNANLILLLISSAFMYSDYCYGKELRQAIERHERKEARVIPIILSPVYWQVEPLDKLQALPTDAKPVTGAGWHSPDEAMLDVVNGISDTIKEMQENHFSRFDSLQECVSVQINQGKSITEALNQCDQELATLFTKLIATYQSNDAPLVVRLEKLLQEVSAVGDGDLRVQAEVTPDTLGVVADCINYLIEELARIIIRLQKTTEQVTNTSNGLLLSIQQHTTTINHIISILPTLDSNAIENFNNLQIFLKSLQPSIEYILNISNQLYSSVSYFHLPSEKNLSLWPWIDDENS